MSAPMSGWRRFGPDGGESILPDPTLEKPMLHDHGGRLAAIAVLTLVLTSAAAAQRLVGGAFSPAAGTMLAGQDVCAPSVRLCGPLLAPPPAPFAGGTA